ncbi:MAG: DUF2326 domain-containing protein [Flavobacteriales bacterium]|nr:DUF2326 domain-containing protein [Flavobacteriales bacterium]
MIHSVHSSLESFKEQTFKPGLNVLLANKSEGASDKQTRNGAGKSSFIEIVHFLLGGSADTKSLFRTEALRDYRFGMSFDPNGQPVTVERTGDKYGKVWVSAESFEGWPFKPPVKGGAITANEWKAVLGQLMFKLPSTDEKEANEISFRSLFPYFVRRESARGFSHFTKHAEQQQPGDVQMALSYLLGFDVSIAQEWQHVRDREKGLGELRKVASKGWLGHMVSTVADLKSRLAVAKDEMRTLKVGLIEFKVLPEYAAIEKEASQLTKEINALADANTLDRKRILDLEEALRNEAPPPQGDLERLYKEAGVIVNPEALRRYVEVQAFHDSVVRNRRDYIGGELEEAMRRVEQREVEKAKKDARRAELMNTLSTGGALEHFERLRSNLTRREAEVQNLEQQLKAAEQLDSRKTELEIERKQLLVRLRQDLNERDEILSEAIVAFEKTSKAVLEQAGHLNIEPTDNGLKLSIEVPNARSRGIKNMQIFCFDMMLMRLCAKRGIGPGFLIHDSHLFDGVDGRQLAHALEVGARTAEELGFQYIVTMNSDDLYKETLKSFDLAPYVLETRLTDASETGGLFGFRFD